MIRYVILFFLYVSLGVCEAQNNLPQEHFPVNYKMRKRVEFWKKVFTEIDSSKGYIHDAINPHLVYEIINIKNLNKKERIRLVKYTKQKIIKTLRFLRKNSPKNGYQKKIKSLIDEAKVQNKNSLQKSLRFQRGMADHYFVGLKRSYKYIKYIKRELFKNNVPEDLAYLPHVESSFNYKAYSKVGAAGIWQLMPLIAKHYGLKINRRVDERRDPIYASQAAAKLLRDNYKRFKSWPLALTAYNHGPGSVSRAVRKVGSSDISKIIENYKHRRFGFASKNFYATFVATAEVSKQVSKFFPSFKKSKSLEFYKVGLTESLRPYTLIRKLNLDESSFKYLNLSIRPHIYRYDLPLPKKYKLRLPKTSKMDRIKAIALINGLKSKDQKDFRLKIYKVRKGESLNSISRKFNVSKKNIIFHNNLVRPSFLMAGSYLKIPLKKRKKAKLSRSINNSSKKNLYSLVELGKELFSLKVMPNETLSHYLSWSRRSKANLFGYSKKTKVKIGKDIVINLNPNIRNEFEKKRLIFHKGIKTKYFKRNTIVGTLKYQIKEGDTLEKISRTYKIPLWLLFTLKENGAFFNFSPGDKIELPRIKRNI